MGYRSGIMNQFACNTGMVLEMLLKALTEYGAVSGLGGIRICNVSEGECEALVCNTYDDFLSLLHRCVVIHTDGKPILQVVYSTRETETDPITICGSGQDYWNGVGKMAFACVDEESCALRLYDLCGAPQ